ncbi:MAG: 50S ribosomal protein L19e [Nanoarchaeota archaeon]
MQLTVQRRLASQVLNVGPKRICFDSAQLNDIKEAITKADIRGLISHGAITRIPTKGISKGRTRHNKAQKRKGLRKGPGSRKGGMHARLPKKGAWMNKVRIQRRFLQELKEKKFINPSIFRELYYKSKGGYFRSKRHIKLYLDEHNLVKEAGNEK